MNETMMDMKVAVAPTTTEQSLSQTGISLECVKDFDEIVNAGQDISEWAKYELGMAGNSGRQRPEESRVLLDQVDKVDWEAFSKLPVATDGKFRMELYDAFHICRKTQSLPTVNKWNIKSYQMTPNVSEDFGLEEQANKDINEHVVGFFKEYYKPEFKQ